MNMTPETDWQARRDAGISSSANHAEADVPGWGESALTMVRTYLAWSYAGNYPFTMESCRQWCHHAGLPEPSEARCWGAVTRAAIRQGIIKPTGQYAPAASSHGSAKPLYTGVV